MIAFGILLMLGLLLVFMGARHAKVRVLGARERLPDSKLSEAFGPLAILGERRLTILKKIGACYGVEYSILRPNDCLITQLSKIDSWRFDAGAEKLEKALRDEYGVSIPEGIEHLTVLELLRLVEGGICLSGPIERTNRDTDHPDQ